jgi:hypothetical protein
MDAWSNFLSAIEKAIEWAEKAGCLDPYFRGHGDASWKLIPSLGRQTLSKNIEPNLYYEYLTMSGPLLPATFDSWDRLFSMRHHALPTRILDWTETFAVALYFAVRDFKNEAAIWILDPYVLNQLTMGADELFHPSTELQFQYFDYFVSKKQDFPADVLAILASKTDPRILAQRGGFTLHKRLDQPLDVLYPMCIKRVPLAADVLPSAARFLRLAGINEYSVFPDLDGLSRWLLQVHTIERRPSDESHRPQSTENGNV